MEHPEDEDWATGAAHLLDPFVLLTLVAANTTRVRVATGVCVLSQRDPIILAKQVASLDRVSNGRFLFGIGAGWVHRELENHGIDYRARWQVAEEKLAAMKVIWRDEEASFAGRHVRFSALWQWPKPVQTPHPPILVGGHTHAAIRMAAAPGHSWFPHAGELLRSSWPIFRDAGGSAMTVFNAPTSRMGLEELIELGATRVVFSFQQNGSAEQQLERFAVARL